MNATTASTLDAIEESARQSALIRARGEELVLPALDPSILAAAAEREGVAAVLRHRLRLPADLRLGVYEDANHPLFPGAKHYRAVRIQLSAGRRSRIFLGTYMDARLTFSLVAPCGDCSSPVPSARIDSLADFGDWLLDGMTRVVESPLFRTSPVHRRTCSLAVT